MQTKEQGITGADRGLLVLSPIQEETWDAIEMKTIGPTINTSCYFTEIYLRM